ncbi:hypothetical protein MTR67_023860, partial [Solanum verrucosum]
MNFHVRCRQIFCHCIIQEVKLAQMHVSNQIHVLIVYGQVFLLLERLLPIFIFIELNYFVIRIMVYILVHLFLWE